MNYADNQPAPFNGGGFRHLRGHVIKLIVAGGILGIAVGAGVGAAVGYKLGAYSAWRLVTYRLGGGDGGR